MPGLGARLGRGGATTFEQDLQNSDCIVVMGSNMAENHPVAFRFALMARERGARLIHVDPRFSRTSALADRHVRIRSGTDIAFLGGLIHYAIEHEKYFKDYVLHYTNASTLIDERYQDTEDLAGLFSGYDPDQRQYDVSSWQYAARDGREDGQGGEPSAGDAHAQTARHQAQASVDWTSRWVCGPSASKRPSLAPVPRI